MEISDKVSTDKNNLIKILKIKIICFLLFLYGCGIALQSTIPIHKHGKSYEVGVIQSTTTGSVMISVYNLYLFPSYKPKYHYQPPRAGLFGITPPLMPEQRWVAFFSHNSNYVIVSKDYLPWLGIEIRPSGELAEEKAWIHISQGLNVRVAQSSWELPDPQLFIETDGFPKEGSFKAELIYNGIMNNIISISYREFVDNMARPAFYQELKYDLNESKDISFRTIKIRIIEATNEYIKFYVSDDGNLPWLPKF